MDERKRVPQLRKIFLYGLLILSLLFTFYAGYIFLTLQQIKDPRSCFKTAMFKVDLCPKSKNYIRYSQVPKIFIRSLILSEDAAFFSHNGLDWHEIKESFRRNIKEWKFARGGSTLTQQLAKNLYLTRNKTLARKIQEFFIAKQLEKKLKKSEILEKYVNVVEFGKDLYGLRKATSKYFSKSPSQLNVLESVYLVSLLPSPVRLSKSFQNKKLNKSNLWRMKIILGRLRRSGKITHEVFDYVEQIMIDNPWPFPHYNEEMSTLGNNYESEEDELNDEQFNDDEEENIDSDGLIEDEIRNLETSEEPLRIDEKAAETEETDDTEETHSNEIEINSSQNKTEPTQDLNTENFEPEPVITEEEPNL